jgi:glycogen operon protein
MGRTQAGNNNAYCQDNQVSWVDWSRAADNQELTDFTCALAALRREHPVFRRRRFFRGQPSAGASDGLGDVAWLTPAGAEATEDDWRAAAARSLGVFLNGEAISEPGPRGGRITDARFLLLFNAYPDPVTFILPEVRFGPEWEIVVDTDGPRVLAIHGEQPALAAKSEIEVAARSVIVLCCRTAGGRIRLPRISAGRRPITSRVGELRSGRATRPGRARHRRVQPATGSAGPSSPR